MEACLKRGDHHGSVLGVVGTDANAIHFYVSNQIFRIFKRFCLGQFPFVQEIAGFSGDDVCRADDVHVVKRFVRAAYGHALCRLCR